MTSPLARPRGAFRDAAVAKLADARAQQALDQATGRFMSHRVAAWEEVEDVEALRDAGHEIRSRTIGELERHLRDFTRAVEARGGTVHRCATAADACAAILEICRRAGARSAAKSKSMATEEIGLNAALEAAGIEVTETDLGEYILQLAGEHPAHIIGPGDSRRRPSRWPSSSPRSKAHRCPPTWRS